MKTRKNLLLDSKAVRRGEQAARVRNTSLSNLVEKYLLSLPGLEDEDFWPGPPGKPIQRPGHPRYEYLKARHA